MGDGNSPLLALRRSQAILVLGLHARLGSSRRRTSTIRLPLVAPAATQASHDLKAAAPAFQLKVRSQVCTITSCT